MESNNPKRKIHDPVHGLISLDERLFKIIDTPIFQRLRNLKQLGGAYFVFPGASHNRFEHSIGTCYLAGKWMRELKSRSAAGASITPDDIFHVEIAALCHDLGHGPFSHTFEDVFLKNSPAVPPRWKDKKFHEEASGILLRNILRDTGDPLNLTQHIDRICAMINPKKEHLDSWPTNKLFMLEVVSNPYNSIDVDKFDYLARDCYAANLGLDASNVFTRLMQFSEIRPTPDGANHICFSEKEEFNIHQLFSVRYSFHREVYSHPVIKAVEFMIGDILNHARDFLDIPHILDEEGLPNYSTLTDTVIEEIERSKSQSAGVLQAQTLINRLRRRQLYKLACKIKVTEKSPVTLDDVSKALQGITHAFATVVSYNYAMGGNHPLSTTWFYAGDSNTASTKHKEDLNLILPQVFLEKFIYVYTKEGTEQGLAEVIKSLRSAQVNITPSPKAKVAMSKLDNLPGSTVTSPTKTTGQPTHPSLTTEDGDSTKETTTAKKINF